MPALKKADGRTVTQATARNRESLWHTWTVLAKMWGLERLSVTKYSARCVVASIIVVRYQTLYKDVSEARRRHTLHIGDSLDKCTQLTIREYTRAWKRGTGPPTAKDLFVALYFADVLVMVERRGYTTGSSLHDDAQRVVGNS